MFSILFRSILAVHFYRIFHLEGGEGGATDYFLPNLYTRGVR